MGGFPIQVNFFIWLIDKWCSDTEDFFRNEERCLVSFLYYLIWILRLVFSYFFWVFFFLFLVPQILFLHPSLDEKQKVNLKLEKTLPSHFWCPNSMVTYGREDWDAGYKALYISYRLCLSIVIYKALKVS